MAKYAVECVETIVVTYYVDADSPEEAEEKRFSGEFTMDNHSETVNVEVQDIKEVK